MELSEFIDRIIAPTGWLAVAFPLTKGFGHQFFARDKTQDAIDFIIRIAQRGDVYHAVASFKSQTGGRTQRNVAAVKAFYADADISRPGDGKDPARVFGSETEVVQWVVTFTRATGLPIPNLWIKSGYGVHLYWTLQHALDREQWQPYANALKSLLVAHQFKGDVSITSDSARILRPVETWNYKDKANRAAVHEFRPELTRPDFDNDLVLDALLKQAPVPSTLGNRPSHLNGATTVVPNTLSPLDNARTGLDARPRDFTYTMTQCAQVGQSLSNGGKGDPRNLWWRLINLTTYYADGREWAHKLSAGDPRYTPEETDREYDRAVEDNRDPQLGAPKCTSFYNDRPELCKACPHFNRQGVSSPYSLVEGPQPSGDPDALPAYYQRKNGGIEHQEEGNKWNPFLMGDIRRFKVYEEPNGAHLVTFYYIAPDAHELPITVRPAEAVNRVAIKQILGSQGLDFLHDKQLYQTWSLIVSWMQKLVNATDQIKKGTPDEAFGWTGDNDGFAIAGECFKANGKVEDIPMVHPDLGLLHSFSTKGNLDHWKEAAKFFTAGFPELETALACSFAAPLIKFTGQRGGCIVFRSEDSGFGKTSAFTTGVAAWCDPQYLINNVNDTLNARFLKAAKTHHFPMYWDDVSVSDDKQLAEFVSFLFSQTQGRDKARATTDINIRPGGTWATVFPISTNKNIYDMIAGQADGNSSPALLRLLSIEVAQRPPKDDAYPIYEGYASDNYGHAGRVYIQHVVKNLPAIKSKLIKIQSDFGRAVNSIDTSERFYLAMATAILVGADIARELGLVDFGVKGIAQTLRKAVFNARAVREEFSGKTPEETLRRVLDKFKSEKGYTAVIYPKRAPNRGTPVTDNKPEYDLTVKEEFAYQISIEDKLLKINTRAWIIWCQRNKVDPITTKNKIMKKWGIEEKQRVTLGAGTTRAATQCPVFILHLDGELADYIPEAKSSKIDNVVPLRSFA